MNLDLNDNNKFLEYKFRSIPLGCLCVMYVLYKVLYAKLFKEKKKTQKRAKEIEMLVMR